MNQMIEGFIRGSSIVGYILSRMVVERPVVATVLAVAFGVAGYVGYWFAMH